jgi:hypothetical protein
MTCLELSTANVDYCSSILQSMEAEESKEEEENSVEE